MQGIIPVAGVGSRLRPLTFTLPKPLISVLGKPIVVHSLESLIRAGVRDFIFVVGYLGDVFRDALGDGSGLGARVQYVVQGRRLGIAHAIHRAIEEGCVSGPFTVHLGDNFFEEGTEGFVRRFVEGGYDAFIVLTRVRDPRRFGYVVLDSDGRVRRLIEKPREPPSGGYTLTGFYAFRDPDLVERAFRDLRPSARREYEITDLIQWFINHGYEVGHALTKGWWKDMGTPEDLLDLLYLLLERVRPRVEGSVVGEVKGKVIVEDGAVVEGMVIGPAYVGKDVFVGSGTVIEPYTSMERGVRVDSGKVSRSLILEEASISINSLRLVDSIIGRRSRVVCRRRELFGDLRLVISDLSLVEV